MKSVYVFACILFGLLSALIIKSTFMSPAVAQDSSPSIQVEEEKKVIKEDESKKVGNKFSHLLKKEKWEFKIKSYYHNKTKNILYLNSMEDYKHEANESIQVDLNKVILLQGVDLQKLKGKTVKSSTDKVTEYDQIEIK